MRKNTGQPFIEILILGTEAYTHAIDSMIKKIGEELIYIDQYKRELAMLVKAVENEDATEADERQLLEVKLADTVSHLVTQLAWSRSFE
jgi:hypothetical protein